MARKFLLIVRYDNHPGGGSSAWAGSQLIQLDRWVSKLRFFSQPTQIWHTSLSSWTPFFCFHTKESKFNSIRIWTLKISSYKIQGQACQKLSQIPNLVWFGFPWCEKKVYSLFTNDGIPCPLAKVFLVY